MKAMGLNSLKINEIFYSIQGEASHTGEPCIFVRTTGCQMRCNYCDTAYAFYTGRPLKLDEIFSQIQNYPCQLVEITGGEPLLQKTAVIELMEMLLDHCYRVLLETGGGFSLKGIPNECGKIVDVKCPDSGEFKSMNYSFLDTYFPNTSLKFVLSSYGDYLFTKDFLKTYAHEIKSYPIYVSAVTERLSPTALSEWILRDGLPVKLQIQLHKFLYGDRPGV